MNRKRIPSGTKLPVHLSQAELNDIRDHTFAPEFAKHAIVEGKRLTLDLSLDDIEEIQGYVAAGAIGYIFFGRTSPKAVRFFNAQLLHNLDRYGFPADKITRMVGLGGVE